MKIIDISVPVDSATPLWPEAFGPHITPFLSMERGHVCNDSSLSFGLHTGTHVDAPLHFVKDGISVDKIPPETFIGPVLVVELPDAKEIGEKELSTINISETTERILFKTSNSKLWGTTSKFKDDYVGITKTGAEWLSKRNFKLIGVDYLSIAKFTEAVDVHQILLGRGIVLLEGINLTEAQPGEYQLSALPAKFTGLEAAPVRAVLVPLTTSTNRSNFF